MKTKHQILLVATCVSSPHPGDAARAPINQALTASPRYREDHPELLRMPDAGEKSEARWSRSREYIAKLAENRALASSPRFLEVHPDLLFATISEGRFQPW